MNKIKQEKMIQIESLNVGEENQNNRTDWMIISRKKFNISRKEEEERYRINNCNKRFIIG